MIPPQILISDQCGASSVRRDHSSRMYPGLRIALFFHVHVCVKRQRIKALVSEKVRTLRSLSPKNKYPI